MGLIKKLKRAIATRPVRGYTEIEGWLSDKEARALYDLARSLPPEAVVVEIGSWQGKSTYCLAKGLRSGTIHAVDPFNSSGEEGSDNLYAEKAASMKITLQEQFQTNLGREGLLGKIETHKGYSRDFVGRFKNIDFLFIDGDHSIEGCRFDFDSFHRDVRVGGLLALHDYQPHRPELGPTYVVDNILLKDPAWSFALAADSLMVFRRHAGSGTNT